MRKLLDKSNKILNFLKGQSNKIYISFVLLFSLFYFYMDTCLQFIPTFLLTLFKLTLILLGIIRLISINYSRKSFYVYIAFLIFIFIYWITTSDVNLLLIFAFILIIGADGIEFKTILKLLFYSQIICYSILLVLNLSGIIEVNYIMDSIHNTIRYTLGFLHPNSAMNHYFVILTYYLVLYYDKIMIKEIIIIFLITLVLYNFTDSRTGLICTLLLIILMVYQKYFNIKYMKKMILILSQYIFPAIFVFSIFIFIGLEYTECPIFEVINSLVSNRFSLASYLFDNYQINLFGHNLMLGNVFGAYVNNSVAVVDNFYFYILFNFGVSSILIVSYFTYKIAKFNRTNNNSLLNGIMIIYCIYFIFEKVFMNIILCFPLLLLIEIYKIFISEANYKTSIRNI